MHIIQYNVDFYAVIIVMFPLISHLQLLTNHYEQNWKYYCLPSGMGSCGIASEEELLLTKKLFWGIFDSLSHKVQPKTVLNMMYVKICWHSLCVDQEIIYDSGKLLSVFP